MTRSIKFLAVPALALLVAGGCDGNLAGLNDNPNSPVNMEARFLLPNAILGATGSTLGTNLNMDVTGLWVQHYAEMQYSYEDRYELDDAKSSGIMSGFYSGPLEDIHQIIKQGQATQRPNVTAVGMILKSWTFSIVTDMWGDVAYSEALKGMEEGGSTTPAYDPQSAVYDGMLADLAAANDLMDGSPSITDGDLLYEGDMSKWAKFANSLRMRLAMHMSEADATRAAAEFADAYADGGFTSNADNAQLNYPGDGTWDYPIYAYQKSRDDHAISATLVDTLKSLSDPRLPYYANPNASSQYVGMPNGWDESHGVVLSTISRIGDYYASGTTPAVLMSYSEVLFLEAEAAERGWIVADAATLYNDAITAAMEQIGIAAGDIGTYLGQSGVAYQPGATGLTQIALQKWISLYGNGPEAYTEWRRTGVPALTAGVDAVNGGVIPVRLPYPTIEEALNNANLQAAISRQGGAGLNTPVWWDQ